MTWPSVKPWLPVPDSLTHSVSVAFVATVVLAKFRLMPPTVRFKVRGKKKHSIVNESAAPVEVHTGPAAGVVKPVRVRYGCGKLYTLPVVVK